MNPMKRIASALLIIAILAANLRARAQNAPINRHDVVSRHNVELAEVSPINPLSVGNGNFAFTVDATGLQTFEDDCFQNGFPLETLSNWAWHSFPNPNHYRLEDTYVKYDVHGRQVDFPQLETTPAAEYIRANSHRIPLGQIGLLMTRKDGSPAKPEDLKNIHQELDLWTGLITSKYELDGAPVEVQTVCHPELDLVAIRIKSPLIQNKSIMPRIRFAYSYDPKTKNKPALDWTHPEAHTTKITKQTDNGVALERIIDDSRYSVQIAWEGKGKLTLKAPHEFVLEPSDGDTLTFVCQFSAEPATALLPTFDETKTASAQGWERYWNRGGIIDFSGCTDPRAKELERRVILSLYLMKEQCSGDYPPQETGLTMISWYGKHHTEMYWWHAAHFAIWGRVDLLENGMAWYRKILPAAEALAKQQGFEGARWPKMTGIDGENGPGGINPFIIWNQPHIIYLSELCYRAHPDKATLEKYRDVVFETAQFMASFAFYDKDKDRYVLGPPIRSASESGAEKTIYNPTNELADWYYGLSVAQQWRGRLGLPRDVKWDEVMKKLSPLPTLDGIYKDVESEARAGSPMKLMALGVLPKTPMVDTDIMHRTLLSVIRPGGSAPSWRQGYIPMTAARLGETKMAVDLVCDDRPSANIWLPNGMVPRPQTPPEAIAYFPVNGALLASVGMMAAGWDGAPSVNAPGFPQDGTWNIRSDGLQKLP